ncbi:MAG: hypothetical protein NTV89_18430, partial [Proteobacteria bacterium]|nr:hypothetical protein [Pseudomonadota bacterium]
NRYQNDAELRKVIDKVFYTPQRAMLMFPFQYLEYNIQKIIATLEQNYGWQAPAPGLSSREYLTSGCELLALVYAVAEKRGFVMHELAQLEQDYASGIMSEEAYTFNKALFEKMLKGKTGSDIKKLADMLGLNDLLAE